MNIKYNIVILCNTLNSQFYNNQLRNMYISIYIYNKLYIYIYIYIDIHL